MSSLFPGAIPSYSTMDPNATTSAAGHTARHNSYQDDIIALATKVGASSSIDTSSMDYRLSSVSGGDKAASRSGAETLANKTINGSALNSPTVSGTVSGGATYSSVVLPTPSVTNPAITGGGSWTGSPSIATPTITKPTITDLTSMQHNHQNASGGGALSLVAVDNPVSFSVYRAGAFNAGSVIPVLFDSKDWDDGNNVDIVTNQGRYTATFAQEMFFVGKLAWDLAGGTGIILYLFKNGVLEKEGDALVSGSSGGFRHSISISAKIRLQAGDYVELYVYGSGVNISPGKEYSWFQGHLVKKL